MLKTLNLILQATIASIQHLLQSWLCPWQDDGVKLQEFKYLPLWKSQTWPPRRHYSLKLFWKCPQFCAICRKDGSKILGNTVAGIKHSCTRSKVNSESPNFDLIQLHVCYSENLNIIVLHFPSCSAGVLFIWWNKLKKKTWFMAYTLYIMSKMQRLQHISSE